jgi:hypothetical protein
MVVILTAILVIYMEILLVVELVRTPSIGQLFGGQPALGITKIMIISTYLVI